MSNLNSGFHDCHRIIFEEVNNIDHSYSIVFIRIFKHWLFEKCREIKAAFVIMDPVRHDCRQRWLFHPSIGQRWVIARNKSTYKTS